MVLNNEILKEELQKLLARKKSKGYYALKLGISIELVDDLLKEINPNTRQTKGTHTSIDCETINTTGEYDHAPEPEEIMADHNIDPKKWKLSNYWSKQISGGKYRISALFSLIKPESVDVKQEFLNFLKTYKTTYKADPKVIQGFNEGNPCSLLLSLPDLHLDKKTTDNVSLKDRAEAFSSVLDSLVSRSHRSHYIEEIVFVIGNDFLHSDTFGNTTTKGTPLEVNSTWDNAYEKGFDLLVESIIKLKLFCKTLKIILIPGNHARTKEFYLAHGLEVFFKSDKNITFERGAEDLKVHKYGETLMCFSHGNNINDKLPLVFASQFYKEWGECKYKEIILGDKHHNNEKLVRAQGEVAGVRMRILPALSGTDTWHKDNLYMGAIQSGIALIYDKKKGKISEFEERI